MATAPLRRPDRFDNLRRALRERNIVQVHRLLGQIDNIPDLPLDVFNLIPTHQHQRNTEAHAAAWVRDAKRRIRTLGYEPPHRDVVIVLFPGGVWVLDGHTRRYMWSDGSLMAPPSGDVNVLIKHASSETEAVRWYEFYDSRLAVETSRDITHGEMRASGVELTSRYLMGGNVQSLRNAYAIISGNVNAARDRGQANRDGRMPDERHLKSIMMPVLHKIDRINPNTKFFQAQILTAAIITTVADGATRALDLFFGPYMDESQHIQNGLARNAVAHLLRLRNKELFHYSGGEEFENLQRVIRLYEEHMYRHDHGLPMEFEWTGGFAKPRYRISHKKVDLSRFAVGPARLRQP